MNRGNGTFLEVYDGSFKPGVLSHLAAGLTNGDLYEFRVMALNYNGASTPSAAAAFYACTAPTQFARPLVTEQSRTHMLLTWSPPADLGGCPVTEYAVFRDDGEVASTASPGAGISVELNSAGDLAVRGRPGLNQLAATAFPAGTTGQAFRLQVKVFTAHHSAVSDVTHAILASVPGRPADTPISDQSLIALGLDAVTSTDAIKVGFDCYDFGGLIARSTPFLAAELLLIPAIDDGGSSLLSYEL